VASPVLSRGEGSPPLTFWQHFIESSQDTIRGKKDGHKLFGRASGNTTRDHVF